MYKKIELTEDQLVDIINVAIWNKKDFLRNNYKFLEDQLVAINYIRCY